MVANRLGEEIFAPLRKLVASYAESVPTGEYREGLCLLSIIQLELTYQFARGIFIRDISDKKVPAPGTPVTEDIFERANISLDTVRSFKNQAVLVFRQIATHLRSYYAISTLQARLRAAERTQIQVAGESVRAVVDSLPEGA